MQQLPLFVPPSNWVSPNTLPDIPKNCIIAVDTETRDDGLSNDQGPGWVRRSGHLAGVSVAWNDKSIYVPIQHPESKCFGIEQVAPWLQSALNNSRRTVFHNQSYDQGWLSVYNIEVPVNTDDTYAMSVMIDENRDSYSLDASCKWRGIQSKDEGKLREAAATYGVDPKKEMWKLPACYVGLYAEQDARATLALYEDLKKEISTQGLEEAYRLEIDLIPMVLEMRRRGIRIDEDKVEQAQIGLRKRTREALEGLRNQLGLRVLTIEDIRSPMSLQKIFDQEGVAYPKTPKTKLGSFKSEWMKKSDHWLPQAIQNIRNINEMSEKFIGNYIKNSVHMGRIHAEVHQLRDDNGGTRSYRFSYSDPPLQQMPAQGEMGILMRSMFQADKNSLWLAADYSQQEPRIAVHFAHVCGREGAEKAIDYYQNDPSADFHTMVAEITGVTRKKAKVLNLGLMYGMGVKKLSAALGVEVEEGAELLEQYNTRMPFVKSLNDFCKGRAESRGFIRLLDGARCRFDLWEQSYNNGEDYAAPRGLDAARLQWPGKKLRRAFTQKAMNRLIQGSAARQTKMAMRECWKQGIVPLLQMHDEIDLNVQSEAEGEKIGVIMRDVCQLAVPMKVDLQYGHNWGQAAEEAPKGVEPPTFDEIIAAGRQDTVSEILARRG